MHWLLGCLFLINLSVDLHNGVERYNAPHMQRQPRRWWARNGHRWLHSRLCLALPFSYLTPETGRYGLSSSLWRGCIIQIVTIDGCGWKRLTLTRTPRTCVVHCRRAPTRPRSAAIAHSYIQHYNSNRARPHPSVRGLSLYVCMLICKSASASSGFGRSICCLNHSYYLNRMLDRWRNELVLSVGSFYNY